MAGTSRLTSAICFGATGDLADACVTMISGLEDAALFLAAADTVAAARALDDVRLAAGSALRAGALGSAQFVLLSGGAGQAQPQPAVADGLQGIADDIGVIIQVASDPLLIDRMQDILDMVEVGAAALLTVPPDGAAAAAAIEDATQELDAAVDAGLLDVTTGEELMSRLAGLVRRLATDAVIEAIARGGNPTRIDEALLGIDNGDASVMAGAFREATTAFETAFQDAEGA
jgi:hypothetical protein